MLLCSMASQVQKAVNNQFEDAGALVPDKLGVAKVRHNFNCWSAAYMKCKQLIVVTADRIWHEVQGGIQHQ